MTYQSPISPGLSWYEASVGDRPAYPPLDGDAAADICIVGGGFTGLSAAAEAARLGASVVLLDAARFGDGASGRNGGQLNTGQRSSADEHEELLGFERAKALFDIAEEAKQHMLAFAQENRIDIDYVQGHVSVAHKARHVDDYRAYAETMAERFGYRHLRFLDRRQTAEIVGSERYFGGVHDSGTGHIHPLKLVVGTARVAAARGARLHENTKVNGLESASGKVRVTTAKGTVTADRVLMAVNAHGDEKLEPEMARHVMPIRSFIGATAPLEGDVAGIVLPGRESVDDSRFVVRYFRRLKDGRLLFGGREAYGGETPADIEAGVRRQMVEVYPALKDVEITHAWGGSVGITLPREPFVREVMPGVTAMGGYSGHGVMLSNFTGKMWAEAVAGNRDRLNLFSELKVPPFPGGRRFRKPLLTLALTWYAMLDRL
ncbi:MAG: FAD-binding oxidoreductase [Roseitalea sp.]|jgi:gamma-glutamylputrescine oxidase|nr:FAD-binding oxidoreductase [Roseitalea sp.]MBO6723271.1 FAD-binding oxidoreductase [Roseitalea sp.]MBO6744445.1 FAD-binding oxidoreductase [Roseitalea sp.]